MTRADISELPQWMRSLADSPSTPAFHDGLATLRRLREPVPGDSRSAAVLMLFGGGESGSEALPADAEILLTHRASTMRTHSGQVAFPGGAAEAYDDGPTGTALREAQEETGLDPAGVTPIEVLPSIYIPISRFEVSPVLAHWRTPSPVGVVDAREATRVMRVPVSGLIAPENRFVVQAGGFSSPAFVVDDLVMWGFTGALVASLLAAAGWEQPWDTQRRLALEEAHRMVQRRRMDARG